MRRRTAVITGVTAAVIAVGVAAAILVVPRPGAAAEPQAEKPPQSVEVIRGDLREQVRSSGTLGYGEPTPLGSKIQGTVTGLPGARAVIDPGSVLFSVDNRPIVLFSGALPAWRDFSEGMTVGPDVQQLEENLRSLGYFAGEPNQVFRADTIAAIKKWQKAVGLEQTGTIELGRVVFGPGPVRVTTVEAKLGDAASERLLTVTGTGRAVAAFVDQDLAGLATVGSPVDVLLPDGSRVTGKVTAVEPPVERDGSSGGKVMQVPLAIALDDPAAGAAYEQATVTVLLTKPLAEDVLIVPILALLAQPDGGFAVEKLEGKKIVTVPVSVGAITSGQVQVEGKELAAGDKVVVGQ